MELPRFMNVGFDKKGKNPAIYRYKGLDRCIGAGPPRAFTTGGLQQILKRNQIRQPPRQNTEINSAFYYRSLTKILAATSDGVADRTRDTRIKSKKGKIRMFGKVKSLRELFEIELRYA
jgi:hypothetical protein